MPFDYDVITVGGGLGGAALGKRLAENGVRVLVLEREVSFRDRVRGELIHPWGAAEARALGLYDLLKQTCGYEVRFRVNHIVGGPAATPRDLIGTTPHQLPSLHLYHPELQEVLLTAAERAGAKVQRGATVLQVSPGAGPSVRVRTSEDERTFRARLVVGADGRTSACRNWSELQVNRDPDRMVISGVLMTGLSAPDDAYNVFTHPPRSQVAFLIPLGRKRFRCYMTYYEQDGRRRPRAATDFIEACVGAGAPAEWYAGGQVAGPLASFDCAERWAVHPYRAGVALIGDAAATSDPTFGCGLSLTLRDVRVLSTLLLSEEDWEAAAHAYAAEHDSYFAALHRLLDWLTQLLLEPGPAATARRSRALARVTEDPSRLPDIPGLGPEFPSDQAAFVNLFGEE